jgi:hypothetical protein
MIQRWPVPEVEKMTTTAAILADLGRLLTPMGTQHAGDYVRAAAGAPDARGFGFGAADFADGVAEQVAAQSAGVSAASLALRILSTSWKRIFCTPAI